MAWPLGVGLFAFRLFLILVGKKQLDAGRWVFLNATDRQTTMLPELMVLGQYSACWPFCRPTTGCTGTSQRDCRCATTCGLGRGGGSDSLGSFQIAHPDHRLLLALFLNGLRA
jgi:hypothetical protein